MSGLNAPRSKKGCWTCRARKIKCDESRPQCKKCVPSNRVCQYGPRPRARKRREVASGSLKAVIARADSQSARSPAELPFGIRSEDWPFHLMTVDCNAIHHYTNHVVPRMVLKTPRWSSYSYVLFLCVKHRLLAHLLLAFSIRDMADDKTELRTAALEHYQQALALFIKHLAMPEEQAWVTFPALWFFIMYEQTYGEDPRVLQAHLRGVRDLIASHGAKILSWSIDGTYRATEKCGHGYGVPPHMIDRIAMWTIHYDAKASTFGLDGGIIDLLNDKFPGSLQRMCENSASPLPDAWGPVYPSAEEVWDLQTSPLWILSHENTMLRFRLSKMEDPGGKGKVHPQDILDFGRELKLLEKKYAPFIPIALSQITERSTFVSNTCSAVANFFALIVRHDRLAYKIQSPSLPLLLQVCASLYEYEGDNFLWHVAWAMFVAGFETKDPIHQSWILDRFSQLERSGNNMKLARIMLQAVILEKRACNRTVDYIDWIRDSRFERFSI